jgi:hypothetical protein
METDVGLSMPTHAFMAALQVSNFSPSLPLVCFSLLQLEFIASPFIGTKRQKKNRLRIRYSMVSENVRQCGKAYIIDGWLIDTVNCHSWLFDAGRKKMTRHAAGMHGWPSVVADYYQLILFAPLPGLLGKASWNF